PERSIGGGERRELGGHMRAPGAGPDRGWRGLRFEKLIGRAMLEQGLEGKGIELVSRAIGPVDADDRSARERQIADRVERLVAHELISVAQPFRIEDRVAVDGDRILQRRAEREALLPQRLDVAEETEGAGAG